MVRVPLFSPRSLLIILTNEAQFDPGLGEVPCWPLHSPVMRELRRLAQAEAGPPAGAASDDDTPSPLARSLTLQLRQGRARVVEELARGSAAQDHTDVCAREWGYRPAVAEPGTVTASEAVTVPADDDAAGT